MIPAAWFEPDGLTISGSDPMGSLRHHWRAVFRCPACHTLTYRPGPLYLITRGDPPAPIDAAHVELLAAVIAEHTCQEGSSA
ncbi:hypothetical protein [Kitasatospora camelliae]|uniref:Uncharacterized protein n=1 Tax=Kitasatospora camelliae TaxID=3156397 RepID=A0AAU8K2I5_9ACTN